MAASIHSWAKGQRFNSEGNIKPLSITQAAVTQGLFRARFNVPLGTRSLTLYLKIGAGTCNVDWGRVGIRNLAALAVS